MELKHITIKKCPDCGCDVVVSESIDTYNDSISVHCNGQRTEHRTFLCGYEVEWVPNFSDHRAVHSCNRSPDYKIKIEKRKAAKDLIIKTIRDLDSDNDYKERLLYGLKLYS